MAIVYEHRRLDTNEVFYIGIGSNKKRAYSTYKRSKLWHNIVNKVGYTVNITHNDILWDEACAIEKYLISFYGRRDLGLGTLINMTDGGDGRFGSIVSQETRDKMSRSRKGQNTWTKQYIKDGIVNVKRVLTPEYKKKISDSLKGRPGTWIGRKHSAETIQKMITIRSSPDNPRIGLKRNEETKNRMAESAKNRKKVECPHCHKVGDPGPLKHWHFDNCKNK
jgi:hypothetical protein